jgi:hypothetical protein
MVRHLPARLKHSRPPRWVGCWRPASRVVAGWLPGVFALAACFGAGSIVTDVVADTSLQRSLDPAVFGRAYGIVLSASIGGIAAGALLAPVAVAPVGVEGTLIGLGVLTMAYGAAVLVPPRASYGAVRSPDGLRPVSVRTTR